MIYEYVKTNDQLTGVLLAKEIDGTVWVSWSACNTKKDIFNKGFGIQLAETRLITGSKKELPYRFEGQYTRFIERCKRYFRTSNIRTIDERS